MTKLSEWLGSLFGPWSQLNKLFSEYLFDLDILSWYFSLFQKGYKLVECAKIKERSLKKIIVICNTVHKSNIMWYVTRFCALVERFFHDEHFICIINYCIEWSVLCKKITYWALNISKLNLEDMMFHFIHSVSQYHWCISYTLCHQS